MLENSRDWAILTCMKILVVKFALRDFLHALLYNWHKMYCFTKMLLPCFYISGWKAMCVRLRSICRLLQ